MQKEGKKQAKNGSENKTDLEGFERPENILQVCKSQKDNATPIGQQVLELDMRNYLGSATSAQCKHSCECMVKRFVGIV